GLPFRRAGPVDRAARRAGAAGRDSSVTPAPPDPHAALIVAQGMTQEEPMSLAVLSSRALLGWQVRPVQVEVHVGSGLPSFSIVGLPGAGVRESRERVRSAVLSSGFEFPAGRITANLAPADVPKDSGRFDLPIALGVLLASGQVADAQGRVPDVRHHVLTGELSLTGSVGPTDAALAIALAVVRDDPQACLIMAPDSAAEAARVPGLQ